MSRALVPVTVALTLLAPGPGYAVSEVGQAAFHFLNLGAGARTEALGEAGTALSDGPDALAWNPALLASLRAPGFSASWFNWLADVQAGHVAGAAPLGRGGVGFAARSLSLSDFSNVDGEAAIGQSDLALSVGGAYPVRGRLDAGVALQLIRSSVADEDATGWAVDAGLNYRYVEGWNAAVAVRNAGPAFGYGDGRDEQLPTQTALAIGATFGELRVGVEGLWENGPGWRGAVGVEYPVRDHLELRAGSRVGEDGDRAADPWSVGLGLKVRPGVALDYAFRNGEFDASHRLGVRWTLDRSLGRRGELALSPREYYVSVLNEVIDQALVNFPRDLKQTVTVRGTDVEQRATSVIAETIANRLRSYGLEAVVRGAVPVIPETDDPERDATVLENIRKTGLLDPVTTPLLEFDIRESEYAIVSRARDRWIGPSAVKRQVRLELGFTLTDPGAEAPRWSSEGVSWRHETVVASRVPSSEGYPRPGGTVKESGTRNPWVEPAIVGGIVTGLAAIFFANREVGN